MNTPVILLFYCYNFPMEKENTKVRASRNRTVVVEQDEIESLRKELIFQKDLDFQTDIINKTINGDTFECLNFIPEKFADLIIIDPPYNLSKDFHGNKFNARSSQLYDEYLESWFLRYVRN